MLRRIFGAVDPAKDWPELIKHTVDEGRKDERDQVERGVDYHPAHVRLSIVHTREDVIAIVTLLGTLTVYAQRIAWSLSVIGAVAIYFALDKILSGR